MKSVVRHWKRWQKKSLHKATKTFSADIGLTEDDWKAYDGLEDAWTKYNIVYGEQSCRLGFEDGICAEIRLLEEDEMHELLADILDNREMSPEERADILMNGTVRMN